MAKAPAAEVFQHVSAHLNVYCQLHNEGVTGAARKESLGRFVIEHVARATIRLENDHLRLRISTGELCRQQAKNSRQRSRFGVQQLES